MQYTFIVLRISALYDGEDWYENNSYMIGKFRTKSQNESRAFHRYLNSLGIYCKKGMTVTEFDGESYVIADRKTREPIYRATPILDAYLEL